MHHRLCQKLLDRLPGSVTVPSYGRGAIRTGIVHLGVGAFHRAHQAVYVDDCLNAGAKDWGIIGASLRRTDTRDALEGQDGLYTLATRSSDGEKLRVIGSLSSVLVAPENPAVLIDALSDPAIRIVTLTVTEKAYLRAADGRLNADDPDIVHDLAHPERPKTVHGFLTQALERRQAQGIAPFTILCCDNLPANGTTLRQVMLDFAHLRGRRWVDHVALNVAFPSSMVDRIVPATTPGDRARISATLGVDDAWPVVTEPFSQWVVEERFPTGRPDWENFGVTMVKDVTPFEEMKLRLLNGAHSALAYLGLLSGHATVDEAFAAPPLRHFIDLLWAEAATTLPAAVSGQTGPYTQELAQRFANKALAHQLRQIATDGSQKLPQRIISTSLARLEAGHGADHLALVPAAWIAACEARGAALPVGHFTDPLDAGMTALLTRRTSPEQAVSDVFDLVGFARGHDLRHTLLRLVTMHLTRLRERGVVSALAHLDGASS
ncbi:mannitol dehydrogenase family protein [Taklimakanibacter deserti]|uniref:mannitol dehydrogenase family protein n=1 Tax=Taklimakanibacter deserti TaxID=2267839 RepID=UPI000E6563FF